ncbi:MAG TPA: hypothetical protein DHU65_01750 [Clostridiales bacterium]|nr:hypothetical protein [Clostridiales bacterium]
MTIQSFMADKQRAFTYTGIITKNVRYCNTKPLKNKNLMNLRKNCAQKKLFIAKKRSIIVFAETPMGTI